MGMRDRFDKAKEFIGEHDEQTEKGVDKAREAADEKTGGKYSDQLDKGSEKAKDTMGNWGDEGDNQ